MPEGGSMLALQIAFGFGTAKFLFLVTTLAVLIGIGLRYLA